MLSNQCSLFAYRLVEMKKMNLQSLCDLLASVPKRGSFDLDNVRQSTYFFS
ncbi:hypothetical protein BsWGS_27836 [Bradybaena similaris]